MKRPVIKFVVSGLIIGVGSLAWYSFNQPATTRLSVQPNVKGATSPDYTTKTYQNDFYTAQIPTRFLSKTKTPGNGKPFYLQELLSAPANANLYSDQLAVIVGNVPEANLKEVSAVQYRMQVARYQPLVYAWAPDGSLFFENKQNGYELDAFLLHGHTYTSIVLSGLPDRQEQLTHELSTLVTSLSWR